MAVLILAQDHDRTADHVVRALQDMEAQVARFDLSWFPQQLDLDAELRDGRWVGQLRTAHRVVGLQVSAGSRKPARTPSGRWSRVPTGVGSSSAGRAGSDLGTPPPATSNGHGSMTPQIRYRTYPVPRELLGDQVQTVGGGRVSATRRPWAASAPASCCDR